MLAQSHRLEVRVTPKAKVDEWLPLVHRVMANLRRYLMDTFHGVSHAYLQKYLFVFRLNRRGWEARLSFRLLEATAGHIPLPDRTSTCKYFLQVRCDRSYTVTRPHPRSMLFALRQRMIKGIDMSPNKEARYVSETSLRLNESNRGEVDTLDHMFKLAVGTDGKCLRYGDLVA